MQKIHRVGIVGADARASWAHVSHVPALQGLATAELSAVATRQETSAREAAEKFGAGRWFADPYEMISDPDIDIVTIAVRVPAHRPLVEAALAAGKAVYCEAPLGVDVAEAERLAVAGKGRPTAIGLQGRHNPSVRRAAELIAEGAIGRPLTARIVSTTSAWGPVTISPYLYFEQASSGAGLLTITAGHTLDIVEAVLGDVVSVDARTTTMFPSVTVADTGTTAVREGADHADILGRTTSGATFNAAVLGGVAPEDAEFRFDVRGTDGWLSLTGGTLYGVQGGDLTLTSSAAFEPPAAPVLGAGVTGPALNVAEVYARLIDDIESGSHTAPDFTLGLHNARLIEALAEAAAASDRHVSQ
ncbi:Gfo/Idh/MocA family oxidoreductase [Actinoplanes sp. LDG1-06]|uniref:Gfo/Idh/MocA family oxidoreductase n=1 Tax=Paractinoplanes ovalisporus TaxID=2810368 RepID=A0ABS2ASV8_9ACTN|nr:Gfo/Idh/MocA family oxidoreductase [Actinoplanes ovalisporus]MBM2622891.1 Gfo/Idh/MocA family oxidoreductase [Actinoplanes ovalisporus]